MILNFNKSSKVDLEFYLNYIHYGRTFSNRSICQMKLMNKPIISVFFN